MSNATKASAEHRGAAEKDAEHAEHAEHGLTAFCPRYASVMNLLSRRWMGLILRVLLAGPHRFNEILALVPGLSDPLLTQRLRELEASKLVERLVFADSPVRVEYRLTEAGLDLEKMVRAISAWAEKWHDLPID